MFLLQKKNEEELKEFVENLRNNQKEYKESDELLELRRAKEEFAKKNKFQEAQRAKIAYEEMVFY